MEPKKMLVSISADTSILEEKIKSLFEVLPEHIPDEFFRMISGLPGDIVFANSSPAIGTGGAFDIIYTLDFDAAAYGQIMTAARAFKGNITHQ